MEYAMYILVNKSLKMGKGKIAAQCCHGACRVIRLLEGLGTNKPQYYQKWLNAGETKIVLQTESETLKHIYEKYQVAPKTQIGDQWCISVVDAGKTQIAPGSLTAVVFRPMIKLKAPIEIKILKLL